MIFEITEEHIAKLKDDDLRALIGKLCEQELKTQGHSPSAVTWSGNKNAPDGGIDVRVDLPDGSAVSGFIPRPASGFQAKAQDMPRQEILDEMCPGGTLRPSIAALAEKNGAYIIVSAQGSIADTPLKERKKAMQDAVGEELAGSITLEFYDRQRVATWVNHHKGFIPWVREKVGIPLSGWRAFSDWSSSPDTVESEYLFDDGLRLKNASLGKGEGVKATDGINALREVVRQPQGVVRLVGLSGVGKTRLVQALFDNRVGETPLNPHQAIYADLSHHPDPVPLELATYLVLQNEPAVLIVDNCGPQLHRDLAKIVTEPNSRLSLITIEYDITDDQPERTSVFRLEVASVGLVEKILEKRFPEIPWPDRSAIAKFSDGNARIAFALAATAKSGESLASLRDSDLFKRLFEQNKGASDTLIKVAKACTLVYSFEGETFDGETPDKEPPHLPVLAALAGVTPYEFYANIAELVRRQLVQTRGPWRALLPHALAQRLAKLAFQDIPFGKIEAAIVNAEQPHLLRSFSRRIGYMHDEPNARAVVSKFFAQGGLLSEIGKLDNFHQAILTNVAPVDLDATLTFIEAAAKSKPWFFGPENTNKTLICRLLRSLAYDAAHFDRAAALLKSFALGQGRERASSETSLKSLFHLKLSGTHASAEQRAQFIEPLLLSADASENALGLSLLDAMLECHYFTSSHSFEFGARSRDYGFYPRIYADVNGWFGQVLVVIERVATSNSSTSKAVRALLARKFHHLYLGGCVTKELGSLARKFASARGWPEGWSAARSALKLAKNPPENFRAELEKLIDDLRPRTLADRVRSYAFAKGWHAVDTADSGDDPEIEFYSEANQGRLRDTGVALGREMVNDPATFAEVIPDLLSGDSHRAGSLGKGLALACPSIPEYWAGLLKAYFSSTDGKQRQILLNGFVEGASERDPAEANRILDEILADESLHPHFIEFQMNAKAAGEAYPRLRRALGIGSIPVHSYMQLIHSWGILTDQQLTELVRILAARADGSVVANELLHARVVTCRVNKFPISDTLKDCARNFLALVKFQRNQQTSHDLLSEILQVAMTAPEHEPVAYAFCRRVLAAVEASEVYCWDVADPLTALAKKFPNALLDVILDEAQYPAMSFHDIDYTGWSVLNAIPDETLLNWASQNQKKRLKTLAETVPFIDGDQSGRPIVWSLKAEKIIASAGDPVPVLEAFYERLDPSSWSGSRAEVLRSRLPLLDSLQSHANDPIRLWAVDARKRFTADIEVESKWEAARSKQRDERFE